MFIQFLIHNKIDVVLPCGNYHWTHSNSKNLTTSTHVDVVKFFIICLLSFLLYVYVLNYNLSSRYLISASSETMSKHIIKNYRYASTKRKEDRTRRQ